jgi:carbon-monoxide dehydrogenase medium subunit
MRRFEYVRPGTVDEATRFLASNAEDCFVIGGGTAGVVLLQMGFVRPRWVVDLGAIAGLREASANGALRLGALTTIRTLEREPSVGAGWPLLAEAASHVANVRVRNVATVGGAVAYGEPQTDTPVALTVLGASVSIAGTAGHREVPIAEFYLGPYETVLEQGELVAGVSVPHPGPGTGACHVKFTVGSPENKPVANVSALVGVDAASGKCTQARVVMGAVGPFPVIAQAAAGLVGESPSEARIVEIAAAAAEETDPFEDVRGPVWYKRRVTKVLVERALRCALQRVQA